MILKKIIKNTAFFILREKVFLLQDNIIVLQKKFLRFVRYIKSGLKHAELKFHLIKLGDTQHQFFFGYYDLSPFNYNDSSILALRGSSENYPPLYNFPVHVGYFNAKNPKEFYHVGDTVTWCWQQGCRLQWYPLREEGRNNTIIYNTLINNRYGCLVQNIQTKNILCQHNRPIYSISPDGRFGLSLNFSRLARLRPGYGYVTFPDETEGELEPKEDGIWYMDLNTGEIKLLFSIADIAQLGPLNTMHGAVHYFNHICINSDGTRFLFFHVWLKSGKRYTRLITCNPDGSEPYLLINEGHVSHYTWKSADELLCFSTHADTGVKYHLYKDKTSHREVIADGFLEGDGHPSYSPNGRFILTDTYPDKYNDRHILLFDMADNKILNLGRFFSPYRYVGELRCDLHPRWSPSGRYIVFDSAHEKKRNIYAIDLSLLKSRQKNYENRIHF